MGMAPFLLRQIGVPDAIGQRLAVGPLCAGGERHCHGGYRDYYESLNRSCFCHYFYPSLSIGFFFLQKKEHGFSSVAIHWTSPVQSHALSISWFLLVHGSSWAFSRSSFEWADAKAGCELHSCARGPNFLVVLQIRYIEKTKGDQYSTTRHSITRRNNQESR